MKRSTLVIRALLVGLATLVASATLAGPASASAGQGYISGVDWVNDDWGDEGTLTRWSFPYGAASGMWQLVLWADGFLPLSEVDCEFGPITESATEAWQRQHQVGDDGEVGPITFRTADEKLLDWGDGTVEYYGDYNSVVFYRSDGRYHFNGEVINYRSKSSWCWAFSSAASTSSSSGRMQLRGTDSL